MRSAADICSDLREQPSPIGRAAVKVIEGIMRGDVVDSVVVHADEGPLPLTVLCCRLRGRISIPIRDGLGPVGGDEPDNPNEFIRTFSTSALHHEAAALIEGYAQ